MIVQPVSYVANKTLSFVGNKRRRIERRKKNYCLSSFVLSVPPPPRSFFVILFVERSYIWSEREKTGVIGGDGARIVPFSATSRTKENTPWILE
ncbi:hypothetical protein PUN28_013566 [Cardiocondyla obscurior]|uniref:Ycf15 n=1 Tax=Cardiocondyla obscurior TaxID=286306 RepID=A0AAW2F694_9HYME